MVRPLTDKQRKELLARKAQLNSSMRTELAKITAMGGEFVFGDLWQSDSGQVYQTKEDWANKRQDTKSLEKEREQWSHLSKGVPMEYIKAQAQNLKTCVVCRRPSYGSTMEVQKKFGYVCNSCHRQKLIKKVEGTTKANRHWEWDMVSLGGMLGGDPTDAERFLRNLFD